MRILIGAMCKNSASYLPDYFQRIAQVEYALSEMGHSVRYCICESDSTDNTRALLAEWADGKDVVLECRSIGAPDHGSTDIPERWAAVAHSANAVLDNIKSTDDLFLWVEADLMYDPAVLMRLVGLVSEDRPIVCPLVFQVDTGRYYEIHGTSVGGVPFGPWPPFHDCLWGDPEFVEADSSGGCMVALASVASQARYTPDEAYVGYSKTLVGKGYPWTLACREKVWHP